MATRSGGPGRILTADPVLVADPEPDVRAITVDLLREAGHDPIALDSGEEVLEHARRRCPQLVILEVGLPGMCGYEVCRRLRAQHGERISIMFVSGTRTETFDRVAGILLGADEYLCKPLAADEFLARVGRLGGRRTGGQSTHARLTPREREVLALLEGGLKHREIAQQLCISHKTVGTHLEHIFSKLGVHHRLQAVALARRYHLIVIPLLALVAEPLGGLAQLSFLAEHQAHGA